MRFVLAFCVLLVVALWAIGEPPKPVLCMPCRVVEVVDGDTITVEMRVQARVRLLDCWAPEMNTEDGKDAKKHMEELAKDKEGVIQIELPKRMRLDDIFTFGRVLGRVYVDGSDISERMVKDGYATREKKP